MRPAPVELLEDLAEVFRRSQRRWYVFGAQAAVVYGQPRMTADVDVTVEANDDELMGLLSELRSAGFKARIEDLEEFVQKTRVLPLVHEPTSMPVDIILAGPGLEPIFFDRVRRMDLGGVEVPVISPEDLVVTKILAGRAKDLEDVRAVLEEQTEFDFDHVRNLLKQVELALDRSDLISLFEQLSER